MATDVTSQRIARFKEDAEYFFKSRGFKFNSSMQYEECGAHALGVVVEKNKNGESMVAYSDSRKLLSIPFGNGKQYSNQVDAAKELYHKLQADQYLRSFYPASYFK